MDDGMHLLAEQMRAYTNALIMDSPEVAQNMNLGEFYRGQTEPLQNIYMIQQAMFEVLTGALATLQNQGALLTELLSVAQQQNALTQQVLSAELAPRRGRREKDGTMISEVMYEPDGDKINV